MRSWRTVVATVAVFFASIFVLAALLQFLAPDLSYGVRDRAAEMVSGRGDRKFRIALGTQTGTSYRVGTTLNKHLPAAAGYELELVGTDRPSIIGALLDPAEQIDLAIINSADDEAVQADGVYALARLSEQYFFVIVPADSPVREFRDLAGPVNPGVRPEGRPPTLGERVLDYYGLVAADGAASRVSIVRPDQSIATDFANGRMTAITRTQFLNSDLITNALQAGGFRLVPITDSEALSRSMPGTKPGLIPSGLYGPGRRIPPEPVPTIVVDMLLVSDRDVPARVVRDILEVIYSPRFARDVGYDVTEATGSSIDGLALHPAAGVYYRRNDLVTSDRLGRLSFVASAIAALFAALQFVARYRRAERVRKQRQLLASKLASLQSLRHGIDEAGDAQAVRKLVAAADDLLYSAEQDAAADAIDADGILSIRSLHALCARAAESRRKLGEVASARPPSSVGPPASAQAAAPPGDPPKPTQP